MVLWRVPTLQAVIVPFAAYALADGILAIASALRTAGSWLEGWPILFEGITGIFEIVAALRLTRELAAHWLVATGGISSSARNSQSLIGREQGWGNASLLNSRVPRVAPGSLRWNTSL